MKKITLLLSLVLTLALGLPAFGQTALVQTTLSAALTATNRNLTVASATGITANNTLLFIQDGNGGNNEAVFVNSVSGTNIGVTRGYAGTLVNAHISGAIVLSSAPQNFFSVDPSGACTAANTVATPYVNITNGKTWLCSTISASWVPGFFNTTAPDGVTVAVASVAGATSPSGPLFHITGTNAITAWGSSTTATAGGMGGSATSTIGAPFCVIPDAAYTTTATNNIAVASTGVANKRQCWTFDQTNKKYLPSY